MVFESIMSSKEAERHPWEMLVYGIIITSISLWIAYYIFPAAASILFLFLITLGASPLIYKVLQKEEKVDEAIDELNMGIYRQHKKTILLYTYLFLGVLIASAFWFSILPSSYLDVLFAEQISTIDALGAFNSNLGFFGILINNVKVATISFILSFFYGTGAIFILAWNASVIAAFIGETARHVATKIIHPLANFYGYLYALPTGLLSIALHGIPEISAYFIAGIAGGILSAGIIRGKKDILILKDSLFLYSICILLLSVAALLEVFVTPLI